MEPQKRNATVWIVVAVIVVLLCCAAVAVAAAAGWLVTTWARETTDTEQQRAVVTGSIVLEVHNNVGNMTVEPGPDGEVVVNATKKVRGSNQAERERLLADTEVTVAQQDGRVIVTVKQPVRLLSGRSVSVDLDIRVPHNTGLQIEGNVGDVEARSLTGELQVRSGVGDVTLTDITVQGQLEVRLDVGDIRFHGILPSAGKLTFKSNVGKVRLELPTDASFSLDAKTDVGSIDCQFDVSDQRSGEKLVGDELQGTVGAAPQATLSIQVNTGDISIRTW